MISRTLEDIKQGIDQKIYKHNDFEILSDYKVIDATYEPNNRFSVLKLMN